MVDSKKNNDDEFYQMGIPPWTRFLMFLLFLPGTVFFAGVTVILTLNPPHFKDFWLRCFAQLCFTSMTGAATMFCGAGFLASILPKPKCHHVTLWMGEKIVKCLLWIFTFIVLTLAYLIIKDNFIK